MMLHQANAATSSMELLFSGLFVYILLSFAAPLVIYELIFCLKGTPKQALFRWWKQTTSVYRDFRSAKYYIPWQRRRPLIIISERKHVIELSESPALSMRSAYSDMFGFKHTMNNVDVEGLKAARSRLFNRLLQLHGKRNIAGMFSCACEQLKIHLAHELASNQGCHGNIVIPCASLSRRAAQCTMGIFFFGVELASDTAFSEVLQQYSRDVMRSMMAFKLTPAFASSFVHKIVTRNGRAMRNFQNTLKQIMRGEIEQWNRDDKYRKNTLLWNTTKIAENNDNWTPDLLSQALIGVWFAASHQPWMYLNFVLLELSSRAEWQSILRTELQTCQPLTYDGLESLPLLDSFIKETMRTNTLDTLVLRRKAMEAYTFSEGGPTLPKGSVACTSMTAAMRSPENYPQPTWFNGGRFVSETQETERKLTESSTRFPLWGLGTQACPGRLYASIVIKLVVAHLITDFDLELEEPHRKTKWMWETFTFPYESTKIILKKRKDARP